MKKNLPVKKQNSDAVLSKTKSLMGLTDKIFSDKIVLNDDSWMQRLWDWADENGIEDFDSDSSSCWGFPREKERLSNFTELNIMYRGFIDELPKEIGRLQQLKTIAIRAVGLKKIPKELGDLTNLIVLDLSENRNIQEIPKEIGNLHNLEYLIIGMNPGLTQLPKELANLQNLKMLALDINLLANSPEEIFELSKLTKLSIDMHEKDVLPEILQKFNYLGELTLNIVDLPTGINNLKNLKKLNLRGDDMNISSELGNLKNLEELTFVQCSSILDELPPEIGDLKNLKKLDLSYVYLDKLPQEITRLTNLTWLSVTNEADGIPLTYEQGLWIDNLVKNGCEVVW